jgi:hypothetical protein
VRDLGLKNPELVKGLENSLFLQLQEANESDFIMRFSLNLLEACSVNETVPGIIGRIIINNLYLQIKEKEIVLTPLHLEIAFSKLESIRGEIIFDYVQKMNLSSKVDAEFFKELTRGHIAKNRFNVAAIIIHKFKFIEDFDIPFIIDRLVDSNAVPIAKQLCELDKKFLYHLISQLSTDGNAKKASEIIQEFKLDINHFPELKERLMKSSMRYYLNRFLSKKPGQEDYLSLDRIEDLFLGFKNMLCYLVEDLVQKGKYNEAKGII